MPVMGINSQPNNRNWGRKANLAIKRELYERDEVNVFSTTNAPNEEYPSDNYHPYENSDIGDSLRETREMGRTRLKHAPAIVKAVATISVTTLTAVTLVQNISSAKPLLEEPMVQVMEGDRTDLNYDFSLVAKKSVTAFVDIRVDLKRKEEHTFRLSTSSEEAEKVDGKGWRFHLSGTFEDLPEGYYDFRIYCQFGFGKNSIYSTKGFLRRIAYESDQ